jgi:hypothetical protein
MPGYMESPAIVDIGDSDATLIRAMSATGVAFTYKAVFPCEVFDFLISPVVASATAYVVALRKTPLGGSVSGNLATLTVGAGAAAPSVWRNNLQDNNLVIKLNVGDTLTAQITTAGAAASTAVVKAVVRRSPQVKPALSANYNEVTS